MPGRRILFLYSSLGVGGAERQLSLLAPGLRSRDLEPAVAALRIAGPNLEALRLAGVAATFVGMTSRHDLRGASRAYALWRLRPDVVFTHSIDAHLIGAAVARRARVPHVAAEHGGPGIRRRAHHSVATRLIAPHVRRVVAVDESQRADLRRLGYRDDAIRVIPNGVPEPAVVRDRRAVRDALGLGADEVVALLVAALRPEKRVDRFIDAVARARDADARIRGVVVGAGPELELARERARAAHDAVLVVGERSDVPDLMSACDIVCLTSDVEGLPLSVLEAMALARPVVACDVGGLRRAVRDRETGRLVARDSAEVARVLLELAADPERRVEMGRVGLEVFRDRYTVTRMTDAYATLFHELLAAPGS